MSVVKNFVIFVVFLSVLYFFDCFSAIFGRSS